MRFFLAIACLTTVAVAASLPTIPPVALGSAWTTIQLPDMPLGIAQHDGMLWVYGANEMIASSSDAGEHWTMRNEHRNGEMLFTMAFVGSKIEAFGSGGIWLVSDDAGGQWRRNQIQPIQDLETVAFGSDKNVYGANARVFGWSHDGGAHWQFASFDYAGVYGPTAIATTDENHAVLLYPQPGSSNQSNSQHLIVTADAGGHWSTVTLNHGESWTALRASKDGFVLLGSNDSKPVEVVSTDGLTWTTQTPLLGDANHCTAQGCLIPDGWIQPMGTAAQRWSLPADSADSFRDAWAASGATFCHVGVALRCRSGQAVWSAPQSTLPATPAVPGQVISAMCLACPSPAYPDSLRLQSRQGTVILHALIGTSGRIEQLRVLSAGWAELAQSAMKAVRTWKYQPLRLNGNPVPVDTTITVKFEFRK